MATQPEFVYRRPRWGIYPGWWMVVAGIVHANLLYGSWYYGFTTFFNPIRAKYGWTAAMTAGAFSLSRVEGGVEGPFVGIVVDRWGALWTAAIGHAFSGLGFVLMAFTTSIIMLYISYSFLISIGGNASLYSSSQPTIGKWFVRRRTFAMGLLTVSGGLSGTLWLPIYTWIIDSFGYVAACYVAAALQFLINVPTSFLFRVGNPEQYGHLPDGETPDSRARRIERDRARAEAARARGETIRAPRVEYDFTVGEALMTPAWWIMAGAGAFIGAASGSVTSMVMPHLVAIEIPRMVAAGAMATMLIFSQIGRIGMTFVGDYVNLKWTFVATRFSMAIGLFFLATANDMTLVYAWMFFYGIGWGGGMPLTTPWRAQWWGRPSLGKIMTFASPVSALGTAAGPVFTGWMSDVTGTYAGAYRIMAGAIAIGACLYAFMVKPPPPKRIRESQDVEVRSMWSRLIR